MRAIIMLCALMILSGCAVQKVKVEDIKPDSSLSEKLPLSGKLVVFIPKNESKEQMMVHSGYGHQWLLNPGENLKKASKDVASKYFTEVDYFSLDKPAHYLLKIEGEAELDKYWGIYKTEIRASLFSSKGELIEKRKVSDSVASAVINDENAFYNAYVSTVNKYFNELFSKQLKSLEYYVLSNTAHQLSFEKLSDAVDLVSTGSGFVINSSGNIVTNYHVVKECLAITTNENGIKKNAKLIASDSKNDIAILSTEVESKNHAYFPSKIHAGRLGDEIITLARMFHPAFDSMLFNPY